MIDLREGFYFEPFAGFGDFSERYYRLKDREIQLTSLGSSQIIDLVKDVPIDTSYAKIQGRAIEPEPIWRLSDQVDRASPDLAKEFSELGGFMSKISPWNSSVQSLIGLNRIVNDVNQTNELQVILDNLSSKFKLHILSGTVWTHIAHWDVGHIASIRYPIFLITTTRNTFGSIQIKVLEDIPEMPEDDIPF